MSARTIKILGGIIIGIIVIVGIIFAIVPLVTSIQSSPEIAAAQQHNQQLQGQVQQLQQAKSQKEQVDKLSAALSKKFPQAANVPGLINTISGAAQASGIAATNITSFGFSAPTLGAAPTTAGTPAPAASGAATAAPTPNATPVPGATGAAPQAGAGATSQYASLAVNLTVVGDSRQFARFMSNLTSTDRVFTISNFSIAAADTSSTLTLAGQTYLYKEVTKPGSNQ